MEFLGENGWPSPRLKDAGLKDRHMREAYVQTILIMRHMYQRCKLVHGDLSEYNLLWHKSQVYVIDVSQSVETDHPSALDFLRKDASNVNDYFSKVGKLNVMTTRQLFEFITTVIPIDGNDIIDSASYRKKESEAEMKYLEVIMKEVETNFKEMSEKSDQERRENDQQNLVDEAVFMSSFLPRSLNQVADYDIRQIEKGEVKEVEELSESEIGTLSLLQWKLLTNIAKKQHITDEIEKEISWVMNEKDILIKKLDALQFLSEYHHQLHIMIGEEEGDGDKAFDEFAALYDGVNMCQYSTFMSNPFYLPFLGGIP